MAVEGKRQYLSARLRPLIQATLKPGWRYDPKRRLFVDSKGLKFSPQGRLPRFSRIAYTVPRLMHAKAQELTAPEQALSRSIQVILPHGEDPRRHLRRMRSWPCCDEVHVGPTLSLP